MENQKNILNIYGISVLLNGNAGITDRLMSDFAYFKTTDSATAPHVRLNIFLSHPPYEKIPELRASMYKTDCLCYDKNGIRYSDYHGKALVIYDTAAEKADIFSLSADFLYETAYLFLHSRAGELLDLKGFHRIHGCAFSFENNVYICMLPQGGGKSTLLVELLKDERVKLISDDTPLVDAKGNIYPFPIRIGLSNDAQTDHIDNKFITIFNRSKFEQKKLVGYDFFKDRIDKRVLPARIICGKRYFSNAPKIKIKNKFCAFKELLKNCVIGYGLPQILEYFLIGGFKDNAKKFYILTLRLYACAALLFKAKGIYCFYICNDRKFNAEKFFKFFHK